MSIARITESLLTDIASAIRSKTGSNQAFTPAQMASAIQEIPAGLNEDSVIQRTATMFTGNYTNSTASYIASYAFYNCYVISVNFLSCTNIKQYAFTECSRLISINFPECTTIGDYAFSRCSQLTSIDFPKCSIIGDYAFMNCLSLNSINFPECTSIGTSVFVNCSYLTTIDFSKCITIMSSTFKGCTRITTAIFPMCTLISNAVFDGCKSLVTISFPECVTIGDYAFRSCTSLTNVYFSKCTSVGAYAFNVNTKLTTASFPTCIQFGTQAFCKDYHLLSLYLLGSVVPGFGTNMFSSTPISNYTTSTGGVYGSIFVKASMLASFKTATGWSTYSARMVGLTDAEIEAL